MPELSLPEWLSFLQPLARLLGSLLLVAIFYWPGRLLLRFLSNGRYPPAPGETHDVKFVAGFALVVFLLALSLYYS